MDLVFEWEFEGDKFSFEDSDRFEEDSLCSFGSEAELCNNWRGWKRQNGGQVHTQQSQHSEKRILPLVELAARAVACGIPFEDVERYGQPVPEQLQLRIAFWSFPENEEDIRLYSCLANGSADEFTKGEHLYKACAVKNTLQIGFHLSAAVHPPHNLNPAVGQGGKSSYNVAVVFDRRRISSCSCSCNTTASWCCHIVALCLFRIHQHHAVTLRAPVSESLSQLKRDQLQKFAQYLISELPQQILPTAQRLLDELLSCKETAMNMVGGAPDPTAGPSANEQTSWCLDEAALHENIKKTLVKFCIPSPTVFSDVNYLTASAPPAAAEWQNLLRPLRGREPEGMWNLLSIIGEMFHRIDSNSVPLLEILTDEVMQCEQILIWWFVTKSSSNRNNSGGGGHFIRGSNSTSGTTQHAAAGLCEEIVALWRLAALNPRLSSGQRKDLSSKFHDWHISTIDKVYKARNSSLGNLSNNIRKTEIEMFSGFKPALEACLLTWDDYPIPGVTYSNKDGCRWNYRFSSKFYEGGDVKKPSRVQAVTICSEDIISTDNSRSLTHSQLSQELHLRSNRMGSHGIVTRNDPCLNDGAASSGSEGFCEPEGHAFRDSGFSVGNDKAFNYRRDSLDEPELSLVDQKLNRIHDLHLLLQEQDVYVFEDVDALELSNQEAVIINECENTDGIQGGAFDLNQTCVMYDSNHYTSGHEVSVVPSNDIDTNIAPSSESLQSPDRCQMYFYDTKAKVGDLDKRKKEITDGPNFFSGLKKMEYVQEIFFARAEALHAHGHTNEACHLARQLAEEMLQRPTDLLSLGSNGGALTPKSKQKKKALTYISLLASSTLAKASFLCSVLCEDCHRHYLAFQIAMFGIELPRPPAACKTLEVKLAHQEYELLQLLKRIPLTSQMKGELLLRAEQLSSGLLKSRGDALLPLTLATFIFESLCTPVNSAADEKLGFEAAVTALGFKSNISEAEHPLLCESIRRQRGELAVAMLVHYKEDVQRISKVMDKLLDKDVSTQYKAPSLAAYISACSDTFNAVHVASNYPCLPPSAHHQSLGTLTNTPPPPSCPTSLRATSGAVEVGSSAPLGVTVSASSLSAPCPVDVACSTASTACDSMSYERHAGDVTSSSPTHSSLHDGVGHTGISSSGAAEVGGSCGTRPKVSYALRYYSKDTDSSALEEEGDDLKALEAKIRCLGMKKKPSNGAASIDSSAPETTSSDNSPTLVRRSFSKHHGPGSDSGSSGESDGFGSVSSVDKIRTASQRDVERYKGRSRFMPTVPNQPSEASAHFMFELAKTVLGKAGGSSVTSLFTQPSSSAPHSLPHHHLHLCAFQMGLYSLGLSNCVSPNWLSRTYSSHVSWIAGQALEIGCAAVRMIIDTWEGHLTPPEVASFADRASRGRDPAVVRVAAELALSCLPHSHALNPSEVQRALYQCREQSWHMLEQACFAVERAAEGGGVFPEVLFDVARHWYGMAEEVGVAGSVVGVVLPNGSGSSDVTCRRYEPRSPNAAGAGTLTQVSSAMVPTPVGSGPVPLVSVHHTVISTVVGGGLAIGAMASQSQSIPGHQVLANIHGPLSQAAVVIPYTLAAQQANPHLPGQMTASPYLPATFNYVATALPMQHLAVHPHSHPAFVTAYQHGGTFAAPPFPPGFIQGHPSGGHVFHASPPCLRQMMAGVPTAGPLYPSVSSQLVPSMASLPPLPAHQPDDSTGSPASSTIASGRLPLLNMAAPLLYAGTYTPAQYRYIAAAFRVGMLAMETLARRVHDDRPQTKYARNPPYGEDVKWLLTITIKMGTMFLQQFCASAVNAVVSPFVLHDLAFEAAKFLSHNNPVHLSNQLRSNILNPLYQKCLQMFIQCAHQRIHHISNSDYDEFVGILCMARNAFYLAPGGIVQFNELLQSLRRSKSCRKELWQRLVSGLAPPPYDGCPM